MTAQMRVSSAPGDLVDALTRPHTVLLTGATGFIGSRLAQALSAAGHDVIALTRDPAKARALTPPFRLITSLDQLPAGTRIDAIVNLAGEPVAGGLWTRARRRRILSSRLRITRALLRLIGRLQQQPKVLISASAIGCPSGLCSSAIATMKDAPSATATKPARRAAAGAPRPSWNATRTVAAWLKPSGTMKVTLATLRTS